MKATVSKYPKMLLLTPLSMKKLTKFCHSSKEILDLFDLNGYSLAGSCEYGLVIERAGSHFLVPNLKSIPLGIYVLESLAKIQLDIYVPFVNSLLGLKVLEQAVEESSKYWFQVIQPGLFEFLPLTESHLTMLYNKKILTIGD